MTREEQIIEAGIEYTMQNNPVCISGDNLYEMAKMLNRNRSFEAGVCWADSHPTNMWHEAGERPKCKKLIVIYRDDIGCIPIDTLIYHGDADCHWKELVKTYNIIYWAYAKDILPKGVEK